MQIVVSEYGTDLRGQQLRLLMQGARRPLAIGTCAILLAAFLIHGELPARYISIWAVAGFILAAGRFAIISRTERLLGDAVRLKRWSMVYAAALFLAGLNWGSLMLFWSSGLPTATQMELLLFPIALAAGAVAGYGV